DEERDVRLATIEILQGQSNLSEQIPKVVAAPLKDEDFNVRPAAIEVLQGKLNWSEEILGWWAAQFETKTITLG
ncbi:hypothetical protein LTR96_011982, partial [Exophiala xenobiotica]